MQRGNQQEAAATEREDQATGQKTSSHRSKVQRAVTPPGPRLTVGAAELDDVGVNKNTTPNTAATAATPRVTSAINACVLVLSSSFGFSTGSRDAFS